MEIRFGLIGGGYMGKAHSIALKSVATVFDTKLRPVCEMICTTSAEGAAEKARSLGYNRSTSDWREVVADPAVQAIVIASPQRTHREIALAAFAAGKPVFCEKPLGASIEDARLMCAAADRAGVANMTGFNYIRTPASQLARELVMNGEIGDVTYVRAEHTEDFLSEAGTHADWRTRDPATGTMGDLSPHIINAVLRLIGPIERVVSDIAKVHAKRPGPEGMEPVANDDQAHFLCRFGNGAFGSILISRIATGRKMGYAYEITGTAGAIRFDQEDQNALWFYDGRVKEGRRGFTKIITGPEHPDYGYFCLGPGHGTGYNDQIVIEARDFLSAIETGKPVFPTFEDGLAVSKVVAAVIKSNEERTWVRLADI